MYGHAFVARQDTFGDCQRRALLMKGIGVLAWGGAMSGEEAFAEWVFVKSTGSKKPRQRLFFLLRDKGYFANASGKSSKTQDKMGLAFFAYQAV